MQNVATGGGTSDLAAAAPVAPFPAPPAPAPPTQAERRVAAATTLRARVRECLLSNCSQHILPADKMVRESRLVVDARRLGVCAVHLSDSSCDIDSVLLRYCQKCRKFHTLENFSGIEKTCIAKKTTYNLSKRRKIIEHGEENFDILKVLDIVDEIAESTEVLPVPFDKEIQGRLQDPPPMPKLGSEAFLNGLGQAGGYRIRLTLVTDIGGESEPIDLTTYAACNSVLKYLDQSNSGVTETQRVAWLKYASDARQKAVDEANTKAAADCFDKLNAEARAALLAKYVIPATGGGGGEH